MRRINPHALADEILRALKPRRSLTGREFIEMAGYSMVSALQAATGVSDKLIDRAIDEDNIRIDFEVQGLMAAPVVLVLRAGGRRIELRAWTVTLVRSVRPLLRRRPAHAHAS